MGGGGWGGKSHPVLASKLQQRTGNRAHYRTHFSMVSVPFELWTLRIFTSTGSE